MEGRSKESLNAPPAIFSTLTALKTSALGEVFSSHSTATFSISASGPKVECIAGGACDYVYCPTAGHIFVLPHISILCRRKSGLLLEKFRECQRIVIPYGVAYVLNGKLRGF